MRSLIFLSGFVLVLAGCGSDQISVVRNTGGTPGTGGASGMGGSAGMGGESGVGGETGAAGMGGASGMGGSMATGLCNNSSDLDAIANAGASLESIGASCGSSTCLGQLGDPDAYGSCVSSCIQSNVSGLSAGCADCYGDVGACGLRASCFSCASDTCSTECLDCLNGANCLTRLDACTGIPAEVCQ